MKIHQNDLFRVMDVEVEEKEGVLQKNNRNSHVIKTPVYQAKDVKKLRAKLQMSQKVFAKLMGSSIRTIEYWEAGAKKTSGAANRLMQVFDLDPELPEVLGFIEKQE
ncbi:type II toxin-antitoxin system MqsA family antitoxin [Listeria innocua]|uniref:helix-turn-helix domain-containing protein n=1 Tax=Listeria innocua TaxID=1642 RepID=UPI00162645A3|nr:type II toxin-antitoxin system MqsA family antitoxin [Listeria innocua]MBC1339424.1 type II toxin-antitoxin system MqsA family antitoxin [Listeria innocua]MBC1353664.1 type II toxin-antitoxin system MqsA family antitoxin [Listeria innocua]